MAVTLVLGGARSGKSRFALARAEAGAGRPVMIATAEALDEEMARRVAAHRAERDGRWRTVEAPLELAAALRTLEPGETGVVDCLTLWLSNLMHAGRDVEAAGAGLLDALRGPAEVVLVSNEVGLGLVPDNALGRAFRDHAGRLHQRIAAAADEVVLVVAGLPLVLKRDGRPAGPRVDG